MTSYRDIALTPSVLRLQDHKGSREMLSVSGESPPQGSHLLDPMERELIATRDSFYLATVSESGWPYVQHRGGNRGFVTILDDHTIGWAERNGNRMYLGTGNITATGRVAAIFIDYPTRTRLKLYGEATYHTDPSQEILEFLDAAEIRSDGAITVEVLGTQWNCPKYITPRYTREQVDGVVAHLEARVAELEAQLASLAAD